MDKKLNLLGHKSNIPEKKGLHPRNKHKFRYDFKTLILSYLALEKYVIKNKFGDSAIDFANPLAVKALNTALLKHFYQINWDIPDGFLCPPIPGRADYIHYVADLLSVCNNQTIPTGKKIKVLDVGVGANCIYPIIGQKEYGWSFVGSEIDNLAIKSATNIVALNPSLNNITLKLQGSKSAIFQHIIQQQEMFDLTICNPPFHASAAEALASTQKKANNLGFKNQAKPTLNFGGKNTELWTEGGEIAFILKMIAESELYKNQCFWFTTLVSKSENLKEIAYYLAKINVFEARIIPMEQGNKVSRIFAWTFLNKQHQLNWKNKNWL